MKKLLVAVVLFSSIFLVAKDRPDPRLATLTSVFVSGNNEACVEARKLISEGKTCFVLATKAEDADGVLAIDDQSQSRGERNWIASATLTLKSGDMVWSQSERFGDTPFRSGAKVAGELLVKHLAISANCKERPKK